MVAEVQVLVRGLTTVRSPMTGGRATRPTVGRGIRAHGGQSRGQAHGAAKDALRRLALACSALPEVV